MLNLIPSVKQLQVQEGVLENLSVCYEKGTMHPGIEEALSALPFDEAGTKLEIQIAEQAEENKEAYKLWINASGIKIEAYAPAGAFYAVQTLKQIWANGTVPYLEIADQPDFEHRGFYHDITRGKVPTVETMKQFIDQMAYYKMNSLQLYVEHVYEFEECKELFEKFGMYTKEEMQELDQYCKERFIDFIPSLSTFGHLYELLEQDQYRHLRVLNDFEACENMWHERMAHHTINPLLQESEDVIKSLIDQFAPAFTSETFNICCDETFDLTLLDSEIETGKLYVDFTKKIIDHVKAKGKKIMMWADILIEHPEYISEIPEETIFLNWDYAANPPEEKVKQLADLGRKQIVCPGTGTWRRLCEDVAVEEQNIVKFIDYGYKHGAMGVLNTNWGDWGNPASLELSMYGMVLGAAKSWAAETTVTDEFYGAVNHLLYGADGAIQLLRTVSDAQDLVKWMPFTVDYLEHRYQKEMEPKLPPFKFTEENVQVIQQTLKTCREVLAEQNWKFAEAKEELLICIEGICVMAELAANLKGIAVERITDTKEWLAAYSAKWEQKNKPCELGRIQEMFEYLEAQTK